MKELLGLFLISVLNSAFLPVSGQLKVMGPFSVIQEGFFPREIDTEYFSVETTMRGREEKLIYGNFTYKVPVHKLGIVADFYKENNNQWQKYGYTTTMDNMCDNPHKMDGFERCFTGKIDKATCSIAAGRYTLNGYTVEEDIKAATDKMVYGHWKLNLKFTGEVNGKRSDLGEVYYQLWIVEENNNRKQSGKSNKSKGKKNKD